MYEEIEIEKQDFAGGWIAVTWPRPNASRRVHSDNRNTGVEVIDTLQEIQTIHHVDSQNPFLPLVDLHRHRRHTPAQRVDRLPPHRV